MITEQTVCTLVVGLDPDALARWIEAAWVRPERHAGGFVFREIDLARVRLIHELTADLAIDEETLPVVLGLLDEVHALRRQLRLVCGAIETAGPPGLRREIAERLARAGHVMDDP